MKIFNLVPQEKQFIGSIISGAMGLIGANKQNKSNEKINDQNAALQREFAKEGIQWKVADAKKAGIHPVYALGANTVSASPSYVGSDATGQAWSNAGQNLGVAINNLMDESSRLQNDLLRSQVRGQELDNDMKASQLRLQSGTQSAPAFPSLNGDSGSISGAFTKHLPSEIIGQNPARPNEQAGSPPSYQYFRTGKNSYSVQMSEQMKTATEDDFMSEIPWHIKHRINPPPPPFSAKKGEYWSWSPMLQEWTLKQDSWKRNFEVFPFSSKIVKGR